MLKVHHLRAAGYIRGNVRWPRGTHYFADGALKVLTKAQLEEIDRDPAIKIERVNKAPEGAEVIKQLDLVVRPDGKTENGGASGDSGNKNNAPDEPSAFDEDGKTRIPLEDYMRKMQGADPEHKNEAWWTQSGKPEVAFLNDKGYDVNAQQRNAAWEKVKP